MPSPGVAPRDQGITASRSANNSDNICLDLRSRKTVMTEHPRISLSSDVLAGKPVIRGTRLSVEFVLGLLADRWSETDIFANYPNVTHEDIIACLAYACVAPW